MRYVAIGRSEVLYNSIEFLMKKGHELAGIITDVGAAEYSRQITDFEKISRNHQVPFLVASNPEKINEFLEKMKNLDIGISVNHRRIIGKSTIDFFKHGILNFHGGDLPRYRGNACQAWAIINGESKIGACVYKVEPNILDSGKILVREFFHLTEQTKIADCLEWLRSMGPKMFGEAVHRLNSDENFFLENTTRDLNSGFRCFERRPSDGYIDWNMEAEDIRRLVNASGHPYFGAFTFLNGKLLKIYDVKVGQMTENFVAIPGQIILVGRDHVKVACGRKGGVIEIHSLEYENGETTIQKVINSTRLRLGPRYAVLN